MDTQHCITDESKGEVKTKIKMYGLKNEIEKFQETNI